MPLSYVKPMMKKILVFVLFVVGVFCGIVVTREGDFIISRSGIIAKSPENIFSYINDLHQFQEWSPWAKVDPNATASWSGPSAGPGASFSWSGNSEVGEGTMTIVESRPNDYVKFRLDFKRPFSATNMAEFKLKPSNGSTELTWSMSGTNGFLAKAVGMFLDCDKMVGGYFEKGIQNLKGVVEK